MAGPMCRTLHHRLGRRNTLIVLAAAPRAIRRALGRASRLRLTRRPGRGEWSAIQSSAICSTRRSRLAFRIRTLAAEPGGAIVAWDQEKWTDGLRHHRADARTLLVAYTALRAANLEQVRRLSPAQRAAAGRHPEYGRIRVPQMLEHWAEHDLNHLAQIRATLRG